MPLQKIIVPTMKELFIRQIEELILSGELAIGDRLPNERELAAQMNVSRTIVNSGIQELAKNGFVCIVPRKGTFVNDYMHNGNLGTLEKITRYNNGQFDPNTLEALIEYRLINEEKCVYLAAQRRTDRDLKNLYEILDDLERCEDANTQVQLNIRLHRHIFIATQNTIYPLVYNTFGEALESMTTFLFRHLGRDVICKAKRDIINAIAAQDAPLAESLTIEYGDHCQKIIAQEYPHIHFS